MTRRRIQRWVAKAFYAMDDIRYQSRAYRNFQMKLNTRRLQHSYHSWVKYLVWCKKFNFYRNQNIYKLKFGIFCRWKFYTNNHSEMRNFKKLRLKNCYEDCWYCLKMNAKVERHMRLKKSSNVLLFNTAIPLIFIKRWKKYNTLCKFITVTNKKLRENLLVYALSRWRYSIYTLRYSVKSFIVQGLRNLNHQVVHQLTTTWTKITSPIRSRSVGTRSNRSWSRSRSRMEKNRNILLKLNINKRSHLRSAYKIYAEHLYNEEDDDDDDDDH